MKEEEYPLLEEFLYQAIFIPPSYKEQVPRDIIYRDELYRHINAFGTLPDDICLVAVKDGKVVGAVWSRTVEEYGHIDERTPSLSISVLGTYRSQGIGSALLEEMLSVLKDRGYERVSLSVQKENYAVSMYRKAGFEVIGDGADSSEWLMIRSLDNKSR